jgi:FMN reductase
VVPGADFTPDARLHRGADRDELARWDVQVDVEVVDLRDDAHDVVNNLLTGFPSASPRQAVMALSGADGLIAVTPIFNASYSGLFRSSFDILEHGSLVDQC